LQLLGYLFIDLYLLGVGGRERLVAGFGFLGGEEEGERLLEFGADGVVVDHDEE
jgi:hypothetical protein